MDPKLIFSVDAALHATGLIKVPPLGQQGAGERACKDLTVDLSGVESKDIDLLQELGLEGVSTILMWCSRGSVSVENLGWTDCEEIGSGGTAATLSEGKRALFIFPPPGNGAAPMHVGGEEKLRVTEQIPQGSGTQASKLEILAYGLEEYDPATT